MGRGKARGGVVNRRGRGKARVVIPLMGRDVRAGREPDCLKTCGDRGGCYIQKIVLRVVLHHPGKVRTRMKMHGPVEVAFHN